MPGDPNDEWKECRASIGRFDQLLVDLRKTAFGFVTTIVAGLALLASRVSLNSLSPEFEFATFAVIEVLIIALFAVDCTHQAWLRAAVRRAMELEVGLGYALTERIEKTYRGADAVVIGLLVYVVLLVATSLIFLAALDGVAPYYQLLTVLGAVAGLMIIGVIAHYSMWHHTT